MLIYGLSRSPILAPFQKMPMNLTHVSLVVSYECDGRLPVFVAVHDAWCEVVDVCARANGQQKDQQQRSEVEKRRLPGISTCASRSS